MAKRHKRVFVQRSTEKAARSLMQSFLVKAGRVFISELLQRIYISDPLAANTILKSRDVEYRRG